MWFDDLFFRRETCGDAARGTRGGRGGGGVGVGGREGLGHVGDVPHVASAVDVGGKVKETGFRERLFATILDTSKKKIFPGKNAAKVHSIRSNFGTGEKVPETKQ